MQKSTRLNLIRDVIKNQHIERQEDLVEILTAQGVTVTQATISRDIRDLQLIKVKQNKAHSVYALPFDDAPKLEKRFFKLLKMSLVSIRIQDQMVFIDLRPGNGPSIAGLLKQVHYSFIFSVLSDDSGVLVICSDVKHAKDLQKRITKAVAYS